MTTMTDDTPKTEPGRARALFSTADFRLLRTALAREPVMLEASDGKWHDSRWMAWQALADLGPDDSSRVRTASR